LKVILSLDSVIRPLTGIGRYAYELARGLADQPEVEDIRFQYRFGWCQDPNQLIAEASTPAESARAQESALWYRALRRAYRTIGPAVKGMRLAGCKDYIFHSPNYALPWFPGRSVSTIHDMSCFRHPEFHPQERVDHMRRIFPHILKSADLFITDSEFSKSELVTLCDIDPDQVVTTYLGKDEQFQPRSEEACVEALQALGLRYRGYTLTVGTIEPRKNLDVLLDAYGALPMSLRQQYPLVIAGGHGWQSEAIHRRIATYANEGWVKYLSYVPEVMLPKLYSGALAFACISHYEGFGLPVLEAIASGVPVITSQVASLPEVGGESVDYVQPDDTRGVLSALSRMLQDEAHRQNLISRGLIQAAKFTWEETMTKTIAAYRKIS
jgi:glycosyltransferase involved in cell wall biosynthesis